MSAMIGMSARVAKVLAECDADAAQGSRQIAEGCGDSPGAAPHRAHAGLSAQPGCRLGRGAQEQRQLK